MEPYREENADGVKEAQLELRREWFNEAKLIGDYKTCRQMIDEVKDFSPSSAKVLEEELLEANVFNFH